MKAKLLSFVLAVAGLCMQSCASSSNSNASGIWGSGKLVTGSKNYVTKDIRVDDFNKLLILGSPSVYFTQSPGKPRVEIYTSDNLVDLIDVRVNKGELSVRIKEGYRLSYKKLEIRVTAPALERVAVAGSGGVTLTNTLHTSKLEASVSGSGDIDITNVDCSGNLWFSVAGSGDLRCQKASCRDIQVAVAGSGDLTVSGLKAGNLEASVAGSGDLYLSGTAESGVYGVSGSGEMHAEQLQARKVEASVAGSGEIKCYASESLKANTAGSGTIGYAGDPKTVETPRKHIYKL